MDLIKYFKKSIEIAKFNKKVIIEIAKDKHSTIPAIIFLILGHILSTILGRVQNLPIVQIFVDMLISVIYYASTYLLAKLLGSKEKFINYFKPAGISTAVFSIIGITFSIPVLGGLIIILTSIWAFAVTYLVVKISFKLTTIKTVIILIISSIILIISIFEIYSFLGIDLTKLA